jgi:hypothetical protein
MLAGVRAVDAREAEAREAAQKHHLRTHAQMQLPCEKLRRQLNNCTELLSTSPSRTRSAWRGWGRTTRTTRRWAAAAPSPSPTLAGPVPRPRGPPRHRARRPVTVRGAAYETGSVPLLQRRKGGGGGPRGGHAAGAGRRCCRVVEQGAAVGQLLLRRKKASRSLSAFVVIGSWFSSKRRNGGKGEHKRGLHRHVAHHSAAQ